MSRPGNNLPDFRELQLEFTAHVRNPQISGIPEGVEPRRMKIYLDLVYGNVENLLSNTFPVTRRLFTDEAWEALVRDYLHRHKAGSPYFLEIPQEFLEFLASTRAAGIKDAQTGGAGAGDPPWLLELCHYEWVELALDLAEGQLPWDSVDPDGDLMSSQWVVSPLMWSLGYQWPVHKIGPSTVEALEQESTFLIVFRDSQFKVRFMESDPATSRFLELLGPVADEVQVQGEADTQPRLREVIDQMQTELPQLEPAVVEQKMLATLKALRDAEIVLGPKKKVLS